MDLEKIFEHMSKKMIIEWERIKESLPHSGLKGTAFEGEFKKFLRVYFPANFEISSGIVVDSFGNESRQLDVIIYDTLGTPLLFDEEEIKVIPIECVYAVIEVKSNIDSAKTTGEIFENMKSVKDLKKTSYIHPTGDFKKTIILYGTEWDIWPTNYFVFALDSMKLTTICDELNKKNQEEDREISKRIDCICVLNEGVIMNKLENGKYSSLPEPGSIIVASLTEKPLLFFYRLISNYLFQAWMPPFQFTDYTKNVRY